MVFNTKEQSVKSVFKKPSFWILFTCISAVAAGIAFYYFPEANPIIHLNLTMNRGQAIDKAQAIATQFMIGPTNAWHAAQFESDELTKTFVELEAGGKDALIAMIDHNLYQPYYWMIRCFKPYEQHEALIYFTPDGNPYGFKETLSEDSPGNNISTTQAQSIAESFMTATPWFIPVDAYHIVETSQETYPSGRLDHTFTYERIQEKIGDGFYRLKIVISGDHVSELSHVVKVPDAFKQRYQQMRSANETIASIATIFMLLAYVMGCCFIGLFFLMHENFILWRTPFYWALFIALMVALNIPNQLPLHWMEYKTAYSPFAFLTQQGISILYTFLFFTIALTVIFMGAESLSRRAFGHHLQLWRLYNPMIASSYTILGYTISAYLFAPILLCYTVLFYLVTLRWFGWWSPSSSLFNPNILASYVPWLESISISLQAGFLEECLFRALPLASAALLGNRFGKRSWWIAGAFILQAIVFGTAHANYPQQPAYARIVELFFTSAFFGTIYLWFGLLPGIITHFIIDVFWFSLPIFVSTAPGALSQKIIIIFLAAIPLFIVGISRLKTGAWHLLSLSLFNTAWQPPVISSLPPQERPIKHAIKFSTFLLMILYGLGIMGSILWIFFTRFSSDAFSFTTTRTTIAAVSKELLGQRQNDTIPWYLHINPLVHYDNQRSLQKQHRFVWQQGDKDTYHQLIQTYLTPPYWEARFVKFEGPLIDRAEEYEFNFKPDGTLLRSIHRLPQSRPGASLSLDDAQKLALQTIEQQFHLMPEQLHEISAIADKQPERLDWTITYSSISDYPLQTGEGRILVKIAGNEVIDIHRFVHVPEQWSRTEENRLLITSIIKQLCLLATWLIVIIGATIALVQWYTYPLSFLIGIFIVISSMFLFELCNAWPAIIDNFTTNQPFYHQVFRSFAKPIVMLTLRAAAMAIVCSFVTYLPMLYHSTYHIYSVWRGISLGAIISALQSLLIYALPSAEPTWPNYAPLQFLIPFTAGINSSILNYISVTLLVCLCVICMNKITTYGRRRTIVAFLVSILFGYIGAGLLFASQLTLYMSTGITFAIFFYISYLVILRFDYATIPIITATYTLFQNAEQFFFHAYPLAQWITILSSCIIAIIALVWSKKLHNL